MAANPKMLRRAAQAAADDVLQQLFGHHTLLRSLARSSFPLALLPCTQIRNHISPECDEKVNFDRVSEILGKLCRTALLGEAFSPSMIK